MKKFFRLFNFFAISVCIFSSAGLALAWTDPAVAPPGGNVPAPINVSATKQIKAGALGLMSADPTTLYGLSVKNGTTACIKATNTVTAGDVEINNATSGIIVKNTRASFSGVRAEIGGANSYSGYFSNSDLASGTGVYVTSSNVGISATGVNMAVLAASDALALTAQGKLVKSMLAYKSATLRSGRYETFGLRADVTAAGLADATVYPIAVAGYYDANNYAELGQNGYGIKAKGTSFAGYFEGDVVTTGKIKVAGCTGCTADLAENFNVTEKLTAGDIVSFDENLKMRKAVKGDATVSGIISTTPFMIMNDKENGAPLALTGIVDVKVNTENGAIKAGDFIVASSTPGVGMKAVAPATTVGKSLQSFSGKSGTIKIIASVSWFSGADCKN